MFPQGLWGAYPGHTQQGVYRSGARRHAPGSEASRHATGAHTDIRSGMGFLQNTCCLENPVKCIIRAPFVGFYTPEVSGLPPTSSPTGDETADR
jgi:hypothetical protein